jgi:hypothetical protein
MSLDGFIAGPDDAMDWVFEYGEPSPVVQEIIDSTGAILRGRRWYDVATARHHGRQGIYGGAWTGPVFVLTHRPPDVSDDPQISFLSTASTVPLPRLAPPRTPGALGSSAPTSPVNASAQACWTRSSCI